LFALGNFTDEELHNCHSHANPPPAPLFRPSYPWLSIMGPELRYGARNWWVPELFELRGWAAGSVSSMSGRRSFFLPLRFWCMPGKQPNSSSLLSGIFRAGRQFYSFWLGNQKRVNKFRMLFSHVFDDQGGNKIIRNFHIHMFLKSFHIFQVSCDLLYLIVAYCFVTCCDLLGPHSPHLPPTLPGDSQVSSGRGRKWSRQVTRLPKG
jgi:hypothetical protein